MANTGPIPLFEPLMRPIKYVSGGAFIAVGQDTTGSKPTGIILRGGSDEWEIIKTVSGGLGATLNCIACGVVGDDTETTYVAGGYTDSAPSGRIIASQIIYTSKGGRTWTQTHSQANGFCYVMAWDSKTKKFHAQAIADFVYNTPSNTLEVLSSSNGTSWGRVESRGQQFFSDYASPLLDATGTPLLKDTDDNIVPNGGFVGWNSSRSYIVSPTDLTCYLQASPSNGANTVEIDKHIENPDGTVTHVNATATLPMEHVQCVARAGSTYAAAGNNNHETGIIAISNDGGKTWKEVFSAGGIMFLSIVGTPT